jgi:hypothetical protein
MKKLGRTQTAIVGIVASPFVVASLGFFLGKMTAAEWIGYMQWLVPAGLAALAGGGALLKIKRPGEPVE